MVRPRSPFVALLLWVLLVAPVSVAHAHDELLGSDPEHGAVVEAPEVLTLTFSGDIGSLGAQVTVTGADGESVTEGEPQVSGTVLEQDLVDDLAGAEYEVLWRVTSQDGHPISGDLRFTVEGAGADATEEATAEPTDEATTTAAPAAPTTAATTAPTAATATTDEPDDADVTADADEAQGEGGLPVWAWVLVALAAAGLLGLLARTWARGRE